MTAKNEIEVFEYLKSKTSIEGIDIDDIYALLSIQDRNKKYKHLEVRVVSQDFILLFNKNIRKNVFLNCVCSYYTTKENECYRIRKELDTYTDIHDNDACIKCQLKCIEKVKRGELEIKLK